MTDTVLRSYPSEVIVVRYRSRLVASLWCLVSLSRLCRISLMSLTCLYSTSGLVMHQVCNLVRTGGLTLRHGIS